MIIITIIRIIVEYIFITNILGDINGDYIFYMTWKARRAVILGQREYITVRILSSLDKSTEYRIICYKGRKQHKGREKQILKFVQFSIDEKLIWNLESV